MARDDPVACGKTGCQTSRLAFDSKIFRNMRKHGTFDRFTSPTAARPHLRWKTKLLLFGVFSEYSESRPRLALRLH